MSRQVILTIKILFCFVAAGFAVFGHIDRSNELTEIRREIPLLEKEVKQIQLENIRLQYEVDRFESPIHLMELSRKPEFGHLKYPLAKDVIVVSEEEADES